MGHFLCPFSSLGTLCRGASGAAANVDLVQPGDIEDQSDAAVAEDRRAADAVYRLGIGFGGLLDHLLLAEQFVDDDADAARAFALHDDDDAAAGIVDRAIDREQPV